MQLLTCSIRRKYFSTLERLQILHCSSTLSSEIPSTSGSPPRASGTVRRPTTSTSFGSSIRRAKNRRCLLPNQTGSTVETHFYLSLPEKIRRQQFSNEERLRIQSKLETGGSLTIPRSSRGSPRPSTTSSAQWSRRQSNSALRKASDVPSTDLLRPTTEPMNCFDDSKPTRAACRRARKPSLQRDASVHRPSSSLLSPKSQYSGPTLCSPSSPSFPSHHKRNMSSRTTTMVRPSIDSTFSVDAAAAYYQDPEARMKVRKYLVSPQKFDEAVAFGFPSMPNRTSTCERDGQRTSRPMTCGHDAYSFWKDDVPPCSDGRHSRESTDGDTASYNDSPVTPASGDAYMPRVKPYGSSIFAGLDNSDLPSLKLRFDGMSDIAERDYDRDSSTFDPLANREMTLRMTLTRPDLRATDEELYGWVPKEQTDPLALETLHLSDDMTGQNGAFAVKPNSARSRRSGVFKKLLDKVKSR
ncbi:hypothetical protein, variant [Verruconis gallopava]|uniref:Uncharacterized protein n=1 Tax=Verruconis gallopava TaxID=253628 RepID=A0A0D1XYQ0_9PEZI|nr:hypothetical protein, variant [Verruconis gallopava]KIW07911.1 hypothetical protein, variant [Verruconis gallopava]